MEGASLSIRRSIDEVFTTVVTFPMILGDIHKLLAWLQSMWGPSVPLHSQRRGVHTIAKHTIYKHLIEKSNATQFQKESKDVTKPYKEICWSPINFGIAMQVRMAH